MKKFLFLLFSSIIYLCCANAQMVHHFTYFMREREWIANAGFIKNQKMEGAQIIYMWRELEPQKDVYDFSIIEEDLGFLQKHNKKLFIQLQDSTFSRSRLPVPDYLLKESIYNGGAEPQYTNNSGTGEIEGWVARRWDEKVRGRFHKLICKLANKFDGKIEGVNLSESAIGIGEEGNPVPSGFTPEKYRDGIIENMKALKKCFKKSVVMQYANFMPGEWLPWEDKGYLKSIYDYGNKNGIALGAPDLMPKKKSHLNHTYSMMIQSQKPHIFGIAVQSGNYIGRTNDTTTPSGAWTDLVPELFDYAKDSLKVQYMFWVLQEPFYSKNVLPFLKQEK